MNSWSRSGDETPGDPRADGATATGLARRWLRKRTWNELKFAWRTSDRMMAEASDADRILVLVIVRAGILDEMERQNPRQFAVWMAGQALLESRNDQGSGPGERTR